MRIFGTLPEMGRGRNKAGQKFASRPSSAWIHSESEENARTFVVQRSGIQWMQEERIIAHPPGWHSRRRRARAWWRHEKGLRTAQQNSRQTKAGSVIWLTCDAPTRKTDNQSLPVFLRTCSNELSSFTSSGSLSNRWFASASANWLRPRLSTSTKTQLSGSAWIYHFYFCHY